ncbi:hypothetical protein C1H46_014185 [Malus baccata]|uniref:Uncharacterized protein n=1 Tax=Malus baccata TaxID=106549 RepID=A0A540MPM2_MALBA|nr:hypothetical protein C1H46_014185 [Malus baccata]
MFHLDQGKNFPRNHLYRTHHVHSSANRDSAEENDFDFWKQAHTYEDFGCYSPVTWETNALRSNMKDDESSPLLPHNHHYSIPCPTPSREEIILQSTKDLMEMIQDMPESCYEISLKDFVDEQQSTQGVKEENNVQETSFDFHIEPQVRKQKRKTQKGYTTRQISRTSSMESEIFLIKVFFPTFLGSKKKEKAPENRSKVSPRPSAGGPENHNDWSKIRKFFLNKKSGASCSSGSTSSSSNSSTTRSVTCRSSGSNILTGCWFIRSKKSKSKRQRGLVM